MENRERSNDVIDYSAAKMRQKEFDILADSCIDVSQNIIRFRTVLRLIRFCLEIIT